MIRWLMRLFGKCRHEWGWVSTAAASNEPRCTRAWMHYGCWHCGRLRVFVGDCTVWHEVVGDEVVRPGTAWESRLADRWETWRLQEWRLRGEPAAQDAARGGRG